MQTLDTLDSGFSYFGTSGALEFITQGENNKIQVTARTSNGDYSKSFQGLNVIADNFVSESRSMMIQNLCSNVTYRSAAGGFNPTGQSITVRFDLVDGNGAVAGSFSKTMGAYAYQAFDPFSEAGLGYPAYSYDNICLRAVWVSGEGALMLYGATANAATNDPAIHRAIEH